MFVSGHRSLELFQPIADELMHRGWRAVAVAYGPLGTVDIEAIDFDSAARIGAGVFAGESLQQVSPASDVMRRSLVSPALTGRALNASWVTARVQLNRHRNVLDQLRPDVVLSFGPDTMSLALQGAAREVGIPSVFLPHGYLVPVPIMWSTLQATAIAVPGQPCVALNAVNPLGIRQDGLVAVGHPDYDEILLARRDPSARSSPGLEAPRGRPNVVLLFAEWAVDLTGQAMQKRTLEYVAKALPADAFLVCKLHPPAAEREACARVLGALLQPGSFRIVGDELFRTPDLLRACSLAVAAEHSMALADAIVAGVPAIAIRHAEQPFGSDNLNHPAKDYRNACRMVDSVEELREAIDTLTHDEEARLELIARSTVYVERFLFSTDGRSASRIADLVDHLAVRGSVAGFVPR